MQRYGEIVRGNPREIVLLKGGPCQWGRCAFCDYIDDNEPDEAACVKFNREVLSRVRGHLGALEVINSGSVFELPQQTLEDIRALARRLELSPLYFECYWGYRHRLGELRDFFGRPLIFKCGIETFDDDFRNRVLKKGIAFSSPAQVREYFDSICLLVGVRGQTRGMVRRDIALLEALFPYGCVNIFTPNSTPVEPDEALIRWFKEEYAYLAQKPGIDLLLENTGFGVGGAGA